MAESSHLGHDPRVPVDAVASDVHAVSLRSLLLTLHLRSSRALRCAAGELDGIETNPALPPVTAGWIRPGPLGRSRGSATRHSGRLSHVPGCPHSEPALQAEGIGSTAHIISR